MINITRRKLTDNSLPAGWFKSSYSASNSYCVEVKFEGDTVLIRDTKDHGTGPTITITAGQWMVFLNELLGQAPAGTNSAVSIETTAGETTLLRATGSGTTLPDEVD